MKDFSVIIRVRNTDELVQALESVVEDITQNRSIIDNLEVDGEYDASGPNYVKVCRNE